MDNDTYECVVVSGLKLCLCGPFRESQRAGVLALQNDPLAVQSDTADVAAIFCTVSAAAFDPVIVEC
ncbi:hypothetical protein [Mycobacterium colombiense]|uniref:hypothetical protein n=1 Tax=Mycobacterium colombiense TaxID=339268 RepID=UPI00097AE90A|nr:hypothetical protein A5732_16805 [Mycobacterium colombiense]